MRSGLLQTGSFRFLNSKIFIPTLVQISTISVPYKLVLKNVEPRCLPIPIFSLRVRSNIKSAAKNAIYLGEKSAAKVRILPLINCGMKYAIIPRQNTHFSLRFCCKLWNQKCESTRMVQTQDETVLEGIDTVLKGTYTSINCKGRFVLQHMVFTVMR